MTINDFLAHQKNKCLCYLTYLDDISDCLNGEDEKLPEELTTIETTNFATICYGFIDVNLNEYIQNHSYPKLERDPTRNFLCELDETLKPNEVHFTILRVRLYRSTLVITKFTQYNVHFRSHRVDSK